MEKMDWKELLKERDSTTSKETKIPLVLTNSRSLPNISKVGRKNWNNLSVNKAFKEIFQNELATAFRRNKNLKELVRSNKIEYTKVKRHNNIIKKGKCSPCSANNKTLYCKQVIPSSAFKSQQTCSSAYIIYAMECTLYKKQYVGKSETSFNIRLINHRKDVKKPDAILACRQTLPRKKNMFSTNTQSS